MSKDGGEGSPSGNRIAWSAPPRPAIRPPAAGVRSRLPLNADPISRGPIGDRSLPDRSSAQRSLVTNRRVVHISGFEPTSIERLDRRMNSGLRRFGSLWGATATVSPCSVAPDQRSATWDIRTTGPNWTTACRYTILRWDELMAPYVERSWLGRMLHGYKALFETGITEDDVIVWHCLACRTEGRISNWQGTFWDLSLGSTPN